jgi:hypothetical protein
MRRIPRRLRFVLAGAATLTLLVAYGCGGNVVVDPLASSTRTTNVGGFGGSSGTCPTNPPMDSAACGGFMDGQLCSYQGSGSGVIMVTSCTCSLASGWSCSHAAGGVGATTGTGIGAGQGG